MTQIKELAHAEGCIACGAPAIDLYTCLCGQGDCVGGEFIPLCAVHSVKAECVGSDVPMARICTVVAEVAGLLDCAVERMSAGTVTLIDHTGTVRTMFTPKVTAVMHWGGLYGEIVGRRT